MKRISVDIGGTFTDCFFVWNDQYVEAKALTTHHNLALGFNEALDIACSRAGLERNDVLREVDDVQSTRIIGGLPRHSRGLDLRCMKREEGE